MTDSAALTALPTDFGSTLIFGCPLSVYVSLNNACAVTNEPPCATATGAIDDACCASLATYGLSLASCYTAHAPTCFDFSSFTAEATDIGTDTEIDTESFSNPCAGYLATAFGGAAAGGSTGAMTATGGAKTTTAAAAGSTASSGGSAATTAASGSGATTGSGTGASAAASPSPTKSAGVKVGANLRVYVAVALVGALAVLNM